MTTDSLETRVKGLEELVSRLNNNNAFGELRYGQPLTPFAQSQADITALQAQIAGLSAPLIGSPSSTFTKNNNTTLSNVTGMTINLAASSRYMFLVAIDYTSTAVADFKFDFGPPASAVGLYTLTYFTTASVQSSAVFSIASTIPVGGVGAQYILTMQGTLTTTTADVIQFRAAQNTAEVSNTTIATDSYIFAWKLP